MDAGPGCVCIRKQKKGFLIKNGYNGGYLQPGHLADRLVAGFSQPEINPHCGLARIDTHKKAVSR
eukprot:1161647-Pelagomonas_calceolata.AAC.1